METLAFKNGDQMPVLGLGTWKSAPGEVYDAVREAIRAGYRHIDCASIYGNEAEVGQALADAMAAGEVTRRELWITSKLWGDAHGNDRVAGALQQTLERLRLDFLDLYLIHWPVALKPGVQMPTLATDFAPIPIADTWQGMQAALREGRTRHIGVSNFSREKLAALIDRAELKPEVNQIELHPFLSQSDLLAYCSQQGVQITAYSPLGSGDRPALLKGKDEPSLLAHPVVLAIAAEHAATPAQVLLAFHVQRGISVVVKSVRPQRLRENFAAATLTLTSNEIDRLVGLNRNYRFLLGAVPWVVEGGPWTLQALWNEP